MSVIGHKTIQERLDLSVQSNTVPHSMLFVGPESIGKFKVAQQYAINLIDNKKNDSKNIVDLLILGPRQETEKGVTRQKDISIEEIRDMIRDLRVSPYIGTKKVLIIRDAHRLTEPAQNALLKTLEEPMDYAVIILVTHVLEKILPTIVSRCQKTTFHLVAADEIKENFSVSDIGEQGLFLLNLGRPGLVMDYMRRKEEFLEEYDPLKKLLSIENFSIQERLNFAEVLSKNIARTITILGYWLDILHENTDRGDVNKRFIRMEMVQSALQSIQRSAPSSRLVLENLFIYWD